MLKVNKSYDPSVLNLDEWAEYLDILCGTRDYQKEAIINSVIFLASQLYESIDDLALENYQNNPILQQKYSSAEKFLNTLQIRDKLHANIDLATGTGKSYVIFGIAQIMLALGIVKRVLVLCPSLTIEKGLMDKFLELASNSDLKAAIPDSAIIANPSIIDANQTITEGDICIENIHAVYEGTGSSITDSFKHGGADTLVLNDESHHIYNDLQSVSGNSTEGKNIKKWKEFLIDPNNNFRYILGFTGTAYIDNEYFPDVIYRYSLREAIDAKIVKSIEYIQEDDVSNKDYEKFQKIFQNHKENIRKHRMLKPLTIMVTKDISSANNLYTEFCDFLASWENISLDEVEKKVLIVTSHKDHKKNIPLLDYVDDNENPIEWIISVSMLTEGWDVKNVFQIVPWEDRAFNSKLLIAQVLGRGLRIPVGYIGQQPSVIVSNHASWSKNIKNLVDEVLEIEKKITSSVKFIGERNHLNFEIYNLDYKKIEQEIEHPEEEKPLNYSKSWEEGISLESQPQTIKRQTSFENISFANPIVRKYNIKYEVLSVDEVVNKIMHGFRTRDWEGGILGLGDDEVYDKENLPSEEIIKEFITKSMKKVGIEGNELSLENAQRIMRAFSTLFRKSSKTVSLDRNTENLIKIDTAEMNNFSLGVSSLRRGATIFYTSDFNEVSLTNEQQSVLKEFLEDDTFPIRSRVNINKFIFKTPLNYVFTTELPEYEFTKQLCETGNAKNTEAWIKSRDQGFYQIEYSYRVSNHQRIGFFNPDYFIKCIDDNYEYIIVVEIKSDKDDSIENKAKYKYGKMHFSELNCKLKEEGINQKYIFHFLSPKNFQAFFEYLNDKRLFKGEFKSELEILLEETDIDR